MQWSSLPETPNSPGVGGSYLGMAGKSLLLAGGANFPQKPAWEGGVKMWHDTVYALGPRSRKWEAIGKLPRAIGYGTGISIREGLLVIGGANSERHFPDCYLLSIEDGELITKPYPFLPRPLAYSAGALCGSKVIIAGGSEKPDATSASSSAYALDLANLTGGWKELPLWGGSGRMLAQAAGVKDTFFLFGGFTLNNGPKGLVREYLSDCYAFTLGKTWRKCESLPSALAAAPSPCPVIGDEIYLLGGDDGKLSGKIEPAKHPGFSKEILIYNKALDTWTKAGEIPTSVIATGCTPWKTGFAVVNGETHPSRRSSEGWLGTAE